MAVLLSSWSGLEMYQAALAAEGIPTYALRQEGFYERREVMDLLLALEAIRDPRDDRALVGFLRSPFVGVRDETLLAMARTAALPYWEHLDDARTGEAALLASGAALLRELIALRDRVPTHELLEALLERGGYLAHLVLLGADGLQAIANVRKLVRMARQIADHGVGDFLRVVREARASGAREGDARLYGQRDDVVTVTSVHSAKGLEWRVVAWCDLVRGERRESGRMLLSRGRDGGERFALRDPERETEQQGADYLELKAQEEAEGFAERKRLWYVAATRAKERMIFACLPEGKLSRVSNAPAQAIRGRIGALAVRDGATFEYAAHDGRRFRALVRMVDPVRDEPAAPEPAPLLESLPPTPVPLAAPSGRARHSATELMAHERCGRRRWFRYVAGLREPAVARGGGDFVDAVARGQIVHDVLEHLDEEMDADALLEAAIGRWDPDAPTPESASGIRYRTHLADEVARVAAHPEYRAVADNPTARRELAFLHVVGADAFTEGRLDLAAREPDGLVALDVKTHQGDAEAARRKAEGYALQRDVYVAALEAIGDVPVSRFAFQFSRAAVQVSEPVSDATRALGQAALAAVFGEVDAGAARPTAHPAECRFCGYRAAGWCDGAAAATEATS
jgi:ATP-dependent helicase/nuclease subunit A